MPAKIKSDRYAISRINVDIARFQNREKLNQNIVDLIAENYDENQFDPLVLWRDKEGKVWLLAGHHRKEGARKAGKKTVKVRWFEGTEAQAIKYAKELSNANRTLETPLERARIYRSRLDKGESVKTVQKDAEKLEGKNWRYVFNLTALNPDGKTVNALVSLSDNSDKSTQQNLEKIADWIGEARRRYPALTNAHEDEMYDFLIENFAFSKIAIKTKNAFIEKVGAIAQRSDFDLDKVLNLKRIQYKSTSESEYERQIFDLDEQIKEQEARRDQLMDRFNNPRNRNYINPAVSDYEILVDNADKQKKSIDDQLKVLRAKKLELAKSKGQFQQAGLDQLDIFSMPQVQVIEETLPERSRIEQVMKNAREGQVGSALNYVKDLLEAAKQEKITLADWQVIDIAKNIRSLIQSEAGSIQDNKTTSKRVLAPSFNNLLRWSNHPGKYDLVGVDVDEDAESTILARKVKKARIFNLLGIK